MTGALKLPLLGIALVSTIAFAADPIRCPGAVEVHQQIATPVRGWTPAADPTPLRLAGITFFDGGPKDQASLAPDRESKDNGKTVATWNFDGSGRGIWVACRYASTNVTLTKELPKAIKACSITYTAHQSISGLPVIEKVDCR